MWCLTVGCYPTTFTFGSRFRSRDRVGVFAGQPDGDRVDHAVDLDADHRDQAEEEEERHQDEQQSEGLPVLVDASIQREIERKDQGDQLEEDAVHQRAWNYLTEPLLAVRNDVINGEKQEKAGDDADD